MDMNFAIEETRKTLELDDGAVIGIERDILTALIDACDKYRHLYEDAMKRMERYRDVASTPDLCIKTLNKDRFTNKDDMMRAYHEYRNAGHLYTEFPVWLFMEAPTRKGK